MANFLHHDLSETMPAASRGGVVAIGNFDGIHVGHQTVIGHALQVAKEKGVPCYALSFEPHPRTLFRPQSPVFRLTPEAMKARVLEAAGLDGMLILPFTRDLAATSAQDFVDMFLCECAGATHVTTGFNFHFGKDRAGSPQFLKDVGPKAGFGVTIVEAHTQDSGEEVISSSLIRRALGAGKTENAAKMLGYRWLVSGRVTQGAQLGRTLGYPTANIALADNCRLAHGIYAVRLRRSNGDLYNGVASFGRRPTFDNGAPLLETFIFDFDDDLYGETIEVSLFEYLRGEEKFDGVDELVVQMDKDSEQARHILKAAEPHTDLDQQLNFAGLVNG